MKIREIPFDKIPHCFLASIITSKIEEFCKTLNEYIDRQHYTYDWGNLRSMVESFHRQYGIMMTRKQRESYNALNNCNTSIIFLPYQPNAFPSVCVISLFVAMDAIVKIMAENYRKKIVPIYLIVDYDVSGDKRFQGGWYPSLLTPCVGRGRFNLQKYKYRAMFDTPLPSQAVVSENYDGLINELYYISCNIDAPSIVAKCEDLRNFIAKIYSSVNSVAAFNELLIYYINSVLLDTGILFIEGHTHYKWPDGYCVAPLLELMKYRKDIMRCYNEYKSLMAAKRYEVSFREVGCYSFWGFSAGNPKRTRIPFDFALPANSRFEYLLPNVLFDYIMDYYFYHKSGGIGYYKQLEMTLLSDYIVKKVFGCQPVPQLLMHCHYEYSALPASMEAFIHHNCQKKRFPALKYKSVFEDSHCCSLFYLLLLGEKAFKNYIQTKY